MYPFVRLHSFSKIVKILTVGRLEPVKNFHECITALSILKKKGVNAQLTIAGEGSLMPSLYKHAKQIGLEKEVIFAGFVKNVHRLHQDADIYLQPSNREGLCISVLEAMAAGLPVIATDVGEIHNYGRHCINMIKLKDGTSESIAEDLYSLIKSEELRKKIGQNATIDIRRIFGKKAIKEQLFNVSKGIFG